MKLIKLMMLTVLYSYTSLSFAQTCNPNIIATAPDTRYTLMNGTVVDKKTGLMWMRCALGQTWSSGTCTGYAYNHTWQGALQMAEKTAFAGFSDWRLPNQKELQSLVEERCYYPAINLTAFPNTMSATSTWFWSSSPYANASYYVWIVNFDYGNGYYGNKSSGFASIRLVRGGQ